MVTLQEPYFPKHVFACINLGNLVLFLEYAGIFVTDRTQYENVLWKCSKITFVKFLKPHTLCREWIKTEVFQMWCWFFISNQDVLFIHTYGSFVAFGLLSRNDFILKSINFNHIFVTFSAKKFISRYHGNGHAWGWKECWLLGFVSPWPR